MSNVIILGDPHIGKNLLQGKAGVGSNINSRVADQFNLLDWTLEQATDRMINDIIITGDVFEETKPHPSLMAMFIAWLKKCNANNINIHIILGNHDMMRSGTILTSSLDIISEMDIDNINIYKYINTISIGKTSFTLVPFRDRKSFSVNSNAEALSILRDSLVYELASIHSLHKKIVIGHLAIEGSIPVGDEIDDISNELFCPINMFFGYDYVWMGHVHKPQIMSKENPYVAHIGSMDISNFAETEQKKFIIIINCESENFEMVLLPTRPLKKINIIIPKDTIDTTAYVINEIKKSKLDLNKSIIRVEILLSSPDLKSINKSIIEKFLIELGVFNIASISESKKVALIKRDNSNTIDTKMDVFSAIKTYANNYIDKNVQDSFIELAMDIVKIYKDESKE